MVTKHTEKPVLETYELAYYLSSHRRGLTLKLTHRAQHPSGSNKAARSEPAPLPTHGELSDLTVYIFISSFPLLSLLPRSCQGLTVNPVDLDASNVNIWK